MNWKWRKKERERKKSQVVAHNKLYGILLV